MTIDTPSDRDRWNAKFLRGEAQCVDPDPLLVEACSGLPPGRALDLAGGAGRHALWLARRGWKVTLADVSDEALAVAAQRAAEAGLAPDFRREPADATLASARIDPFDLIIVFWCLLRDEFRALPLALAPGGRLVYKTYTSAHRRYTEGHSLSTALNPGELAAAFPALTTLFSRESQGVAEIIARRDEP